MYYFAFVLLALSMLCALAGAAWAVKSLWPRTAPAAGKASRRTSVPGLGFVEKANLCLTGCYIIASAILIYALASYDFSLVYVASYTDRLLPLFYRITAFWAGQAGSMLFWAFSVAICGGLFQLTRSYKSLTPDTRLWYWVFYLGIMSFFGLILVTWNNPFLMNHAVPQDGNGLNPLLQNPGMIFHPPLLFLGYGGFVIPSCLALAQALSRRQADEAAWTDVARPFTLAAWAMLTAGIVLGGWWAYMELGWGGYWAWDPVENASLVPWLIATASLHTLIVEDRRGKLGRVNVAMMVLTTVSAFFATYLVRSGVIDSVHAFGDGSVGTPLTIFVLGGLVIALWIPFATPKTGKPLAGLESREGFLTLVAWVLLALAVIILVATMWPVISKLWSAAPRGLDARFYNRVCLPLGALLVVMMAACPWLGWGGGLRNKKGFFAVIGAFVVSAGVIWALGYHQPTALLGASAAVAIVLGAVMLLADKTNRSQPVTIGALGAHIGMALVAIGISFSGPYTTDREMILAKGESSTVGSYTATLLELGEGRRVDHEFIAARLEIFKDGKSIGIVAPERRLYDKFGTMQFSEVDVIPGLGNEVYASLLGLDENSRVVVKVSVEPLVNWLWIGGTIMCLVPLAGLRRRKNPAPESDSENSAA